MWDVNRDALSGPADAFSAGPRFGFFDAFDSAYEAQARTNSMLGLEAAFEEVEAEQNQIIKAAGLEPPRSLYADLDGGQYAPYMRAAKFYSGDASEPSDIGSRLAERDEAIKQLRLKNPKLNLRTYRELWGQVRERAQTAERRWGSSDNTVPGALGGFIGEMIASVDPRTDPLNFATLGVGGVGRTVASRVLTEGAGQAAIESVNQLTGVQENRELLGLEHGFEEGAFSVGSAFVFGAGIRGAAEGLQAGARHWFQNTPDDPAPPAPEAPTRIDDATAAETITALDSQFDTIAPYGPSRVSAGRGQEDFQAVTEQLDAWDGPLPADTKPFGAGEIDRDVARMVAETTPADKIRGELPESGVAPANVSTDGTVYVGKKGGMHFEIDEANPDQQWTKQGFIDSTGRYLTREEAFEAVTGKVGTREELDAANWRLHFGNDKLPMKPEATPLVERADAARKGRFRGETPAQPVTVGDVLPVVNRPDVQEKMPALADASDTLAKVTEEVVAETEQLIDDFKAVAKQTAKAQLNKAEKTEPAKPRVIGAKEIITAAGGKFTPEERSVDGTKAAELLVADLSKALGEGHKVTLYSEGKKVEIVRIDKGMMADAEGQRWGTMPLLMDKNGKSRVEVSAEPEYVTLPNGTRLAMDDAVAGLDDKPKVTVRELVETLDEDEKVFKAVGTCSTSKTSSTASKNN
jgi:hypothetical protein